MKCPIRPFSAEDFAEVFIEEFEDEDQIRQRFTDKINALLESKWAEVPKVMVVSDGSPAGKWWEAPWKNPRIDMKRAYLVGIESLEGKND